MQIGAYATGCLVSGDKDLSVLHGLEKRSDPYSQTNEKTVWDLMAQTFMRILV